MCHQVIFTKNALFEKITIERKKPPYISSTASLDKLNPCLGSMTFRKEHKFFKQKDSLYFGYIISLNQYREKPEFYLLAKTPNHTKYPPQDPYFRKLKSCQLSRGATILEQLLYPRFHTHMEPYLILKLWAPENAKVKLFENTSKQVRWCSAPIFTHLNAARKPKIITGAGFEPDNLSASSDL